MKSINSLSKIFPLLICCFLVLPSCEEEDYIPESQNGLDLSEGKSWTYKRTFVTQEINQTTGLAMDLDTIEVEQITVKVEGKRQFDTVTTTLLTTSTIDDGTVEYQYYYYEGSDLYIKTYCVAGYMALPKTLKHTNSTSTLPAFLRLPILKDTPFDLDTLRFENPPALVYNYPLELGNRWTMRENNFVKVEKEVVGEVLLPTKIGTKKCYKIQYHLQYGEETNHEIELFEYINDEAVLRREIFIKNVFYSDMYGNQSGKLNIFDVYEIEQISSSKGDFY